MNTTPKKRMSKPLRLSLWIGGGIVGLFILVMAIAAISIANQPGGWDAEIARQEASASAKASEQAAASEQADEKSRQAAADSKNAAAQESEKAEQAKKSRAAEESAAKASDEAEQAKRDADESKKAEASKKAAAKKKAVASQKAEASKKAAAKKKAAAEAKAEAAKHPFKAVEEAAAVDDLEISESGQVLFAKFPIADNFTNGMIRSGAQRSTVDILQAVSENATGYTKVFVQGTFPMQDQYGNDSDSMILNVGYDKKTVGKINFDGINPDQIWDIRDGGMVHPELQE